MLFLGFVNLDRFLFVLWHCQVGDEDFKVKAKKARHAECAFARERCGALGHGE